MPMPDFTIASPSPTAGAAADQLAASQVTDKNRILQDQAMNTKFATSDFKNYQLPQLQSSIGAAGQFYGTARNKTEGQAAQGFTHSLYDITSAANRQLDDLTRQRAYAAMGLVL